MTGAERRSPTTDKFEKQGPKPGSAAPVFTLKTIEGKTVNAVDLWKDKPLVLMTGSYTCPVFRNKAAAYEELAKQYGDRVNFLLIYVIEAHPKGDPSPYRGAEWVTPANEEAGILLAQPKTMEQRIEYASTCAKNVHCSVPMVIDSIDNPTWKAYGSAPNCAYLIGTDGKIVAQQGWFLRDGLNKAISQYLKDMPKAKKPKT